MESFKQLVDLVLLFTALWNVVHHATILRSDLSFRLMYFIFDSESRRHKAWKLLQFTDSLSWLYLQKTVDCFAPTSAKHPEFHCRSFRFCTRKVLIFNPRKRSRSILKVLRGFWKPVSIHRYFDLTYVFCFRFDLYFQIQSRGWLCSNDPHTRFQIVVGGYDQLRDRIFFIRKVEPLKQTKHTIGTCSKQTAIRRNTSKLERNS